MSSRCSVKLCFTALALWSLIAAGLRAQENWGTIRGTVKDSSGAVIPGATLTATSPTLVRPIEVATDDKGTYLFSKLPIGTYTITASLTGFKTVRKEDIPVRLGLEPKMPSDAELDRAFAFMKNVWRRLVDMMVDLQRDMQKKS